MNNMGHFDCKNELNLCKLCVKKAKIKDLKVDSFVTDMFCSQLINANQLNVENETVNTICVATELKAKKIGALDLNANKLCSQDGVINKLCVNELTVGSINHCEQWRAAVTFPGDTLYALGSNMNWSVITDDPNNNVSLAPFFYTVPTTGYYLLDYYLRHDSLAGASVITGIPIGLLTVTVNGVELRQLQSAFLSFSSLQHENLTALVLLNAGDVIRMKYDVLVFDQVLGFSPFVGTINIKANGLSQGQSGFKIHFLSSMNCPAITCEPCAPVEVFCQPVTIECDDDCPSTPGESGCNCR